MSVLLEVKDLSVYFERKDGASRQGKTVRALDGVSFLVRRGEVLGIVGESGCGKTTLGKTILGLQKPRSGEILYEGVNLNALRGNARRPYRKKMQMVFQDPYGSLNPRMTIRDIVTEGLREKGPEKRKLTDDRAREMLELVGLPDSCLYRYPGSLSGGQRQRVGIARALAVEPELLICDEPISALDVSIRAQIIRMLEELKEKKHLTCLFIAHDLAVVRYISDRIAVLYQGCLMELGETETIFREQKHPYTQLLISSVLSPDPGKRQILRTFSTEGDSFERTDRGCPFYPRCRERTGRCMEEKPELTRRGEGHFCACHM